MPAPESRSTPAASMSMAVEISAVRICAGVKAGFADLTSAAIAPAWGAAAEVPKNGLGNPPTPVTDVPSAAVMSGFWRSTPPVDETLPGVIGVLLALSKMRRGPSELKHSSLFEALNGLGNGPSGKPEQPEK